MGTHDLIMGIHNSVMDIPLEDILAFHIGMHLEYLSGYTPQMMSLRRNNVVTLSWRNNDDIIALCVGWDGTTLPLRPRLHYIKHIIYTLVVRAVVVGSTYAVPIYTF